MILSWRGVRVHDAVGDLTVDVAKPDMLLVPAAMDTASTPPAPGSTADDYECYRVKVSAGTPRFHKGIQATVGDEFTSSPKLLVLKRPRRLCMPVEMNGGPVNTSEAALFCYRAKPVKGQPRLAKRPGVHVNDGFGAVVVTMIGEDQLCLPSTVTP